MNKKYQGGISMRKPIAAVTADILLADLKPMNQKMAAYAPRPLLDALGRAGLMPIVLPYNDYMKPEDFINTFDALVLPGGLNPTPRLYGEEPLWCIGPTFLKRDLFEAGLIKACISRGKPILGICRGMQILNAVLGGTLWQDMTKQNPKLYIQHMQKAPENIPTHYIEIEKESRLHKVLGDGLYVNSYHKEGIKKLSPLLRETAHSADGLIEGVESIENELICGVQWHPELMEPELMDPLFKAFAEKASRERLAVSR
jgi:putative glutamine amidotransferase